MNARHIGWGLGLLLAASAAVAATSTKPADCGLHIEQPWIRAAPPGAMMLAGYAKVSNSCATPATIVGVEGPDFGDASIHETLVENGVSRMRAAGQLTVPAHGQLLFAPGGAHLMLMEPKRMLAEGGRTALRLVLADGRKVSADFVVRRDPPGRR